MWLRFSSSWWTSIEQSHEIRPGHDSRRINFCVTFTHNVFEFIQTLISMFIIRHYNKPLTTVTCGRLLKWVLYYFGLGQYYRWIVICGFVSNAHEEESLCIRSLFTLVAPNVQDKVTDFNLNISIWYLHTFWVKGISLYYQKAINFITLQYIIFIYILTD